MQNDEETRKILSHIFASELRDLSLHLDGMILSKYLYMLSTGVEMTTRGGKVTKPPPTIGPFLGWMIKVFEGGCAPEYARDPFEKIRFTGEFLDDLLKDAQSIDVARTAARELTAIFLKQDKNIPEKLHPFLFDVLGNDQPKRKRGRHPLENLHRDVCIVMLLIAIEKMGYKPITRNTDPIYGNTRSLCDVMEAALNSLGIRLSYEAIKAIWRRRNELKKHVPEFRISIETEKNRKVCYIGYADSSLLQPGVPKEAQSCWMIKKIILETPFYFALKLPNGTVVDIGNASAFLRPCKKQVVLAKGGRKKLQSRVFSLSLAQLSR